MSGMAYRHSSYSVAPTPSAAAFKTEAPQFTPHENNGQEEGISRDGNAIQTTTPNQISSRIPMPPTVARPLTSRTQILRSKRIVQTTTPIRAPPKAHFRNDSNYVVNSNNQVYYVDEYSMMSTQIKFIEFAILKGPKMKYVQSLFQVNIHIGSVELTPNTELNRTPTENVMVIGHVPSDLNII